MPYRCALPAWTWRRLPRAGKVAVALAPVVGVVLVLTLGPGIERSKREREQAEAARIERARAQYIAQAREEQRPRTGDVFAGDRGRALAAVSSAVRADAAARVAEPILRVDCAPYPTGATGADGRYECLAVTADVPATARSPAGARGHAYRVRIDFENGRYAFCKLAPRPQKNLGSAAAMILRL